MKISEIITDRYKLRIPPTVYYDLLADVREVEEEQEPTTKNDIHCLYTDEEIAQSFIEDVEAVKDLLPCGEQMDFPSTFDEFAKDYGFKDKDEVYTNGSELIPVFRVKQWLEHISTTKNDLGVDCIDNYIDKLIAYCEKMSFDTDVFGESLKVVHLDAVKNIAKEVMPQAPQTFKWCTDCREYDQEKHCCHRWTKVIRNTVEEMKLEYVEREVLDELRAEITTLQNRCYALTKGTMCMFCKYECKYKAENNS